MKIVQTKDYKKPLYAVGIAAALTAMAVTGCGGNPVDYAGDIQVVTEPTEEVQLAGEVAPDDMKSEKTYCKPDADETVPTVKTTPVPSEIKLIDKFQEDDKVILDGGVEFDPG